MPDEGEAFVRGLMWGVTFGFFVWLLIGVVVLAVIS